MLLLGEIQRRNIESAFERANRAATNGRSVSDEAGYGSGRIHLVISAPTRTDHFETVDNYVVQDDSEPLILVDPAPFSLSPLTSLHKVSMLFRTLRLSQVYLVKKVQ